MFLSGEKIYLRALSESDLKGDYISWLNDPEVCANNSHHIFPYTEEQGLSYVNSVRQNKSQLVLAIVSKGNDLHIGNIALQDINYIYRSAELAIIIGNKSFWGQGIGKSASRLICDHAFLSMNLNRISCGTFSNNESMIKLAVFLGMKEEGRRRQAVFKNGQFLDIVEFGVLCHEYLKIFHST